MKQIERSSITFESNCCIKNFWNTNTKLAFSIDKKQLSQQQKKSYSESKSNYLRKCQNKMPPKQKKYLNVSKNQQNKQNKQPLIQTNKQMQGHIYKNINLIKKSAKPILAHTTYKPLTITATNSNSKANFENSQNYFNLNSTFKKYLKNHELGKQYNSIILNKKNIFENSVEHSATTNLLESYNNNFSPLQTKQLNSIHYEKKQCDHLAYTTLFQGIQRDEKEKFGSISILKKQLDQPFLRQKDKNLNCSSLKSPERKNLWNFKQIRSIISSKNENTEHSIQRSEVIYKYSGKITLHEMRQNLQRKYDDDNISLLNQNHLKISNTNKLDSLIELENNEKPNTIQYLKVMPQELYKKQFCISEQGFQKIFIVKQLKSNQQYCLKQIYKKSITNMKEKFEFEKELKINFKLNEHSKILKLYNVFQDHEKYTLITQYFQINLRQVLIKYQKIPENVAISYLRDIIQGLAFMHSKNILHLNIRPQTILLNCANCKISNFKFATISKQNQRQQIRTSLYSPPYINNLINFSNKIDCWAIGIIAYELVYGKLPSQLYYNECNQFASKIKFDQNISVSSCYKKLIMNLLQVDEQLRISMKQALNSQIFL